MVLDTYSLYSTTAAGLLAHVVPPGCKNILKTSIWVFHFEHLYFFKSLST
jgi:hypothetical protein